MSHCRCCDRILTDQEVVKKHAGTGEYLDTCNKCLGIIEEVQHIPLAGLPDEDEEDNLDDYLTHFEWDGLNFNEDE